MKHLIITILFTLSLFAQEIGVPYVENITKDIPERSQIFSAKDSKAIVIRMDYGYSKPSKLLRFDFDLNAMKPLLEQVSISYFDTMTVRKNKIYLANDKQIQIWDIDQQIMVKELSIPLTPKGEKDKITVLYVNEDETLIAAGTSDHHIYVWNMQTQKLKQFLRGSDISSDAKYEGYPKFDYTKGHQSTISALALSHDQKYLYSGSGDNTIKIWNLETGEEIYTFRNMKNVRDIWISRDDHYLIPHQYDTNLTMLDIKSLKKIRTFTGHTDNITGIAVSPDEMRLYTVGKDQTFRSWDIETGEQSKLWQLESVQTAVLIANNSKDVISLGANQLTLWRLERSKYQDAVKIYFTNDGEWTGISPGGGSFYKTDKSNFSIKLNDLTGTARELDRDEIQHYNQALHFEVNFMIINKQK